MSVRQYWVAYDLSDDKERGRVERCISRYGQRLQKSLFSCVLDDRRRMLLQGELTGFACRSGFIMMSALAEPPDSACIGVGQPNLREDWVFGLDLAFEHTP